MDAEYTFSPHHAVVLSPNVTFSADRQRFTSIGFGDTSPESSGLGAEVGYHYWLNPTAEGVFLGPALLLGVTSYPGFGSRFNYGAAFDVGYQVILAGGFTVMAGGGLLLIGQSGAGNVIHLLPRALLGIGWSF